MLLKSCAELTELMKTALATVKRGYLSILNFAVGCLLNHIHVNAILAQSIKDTVQNLFRKL